MCNAQRFGAQYEFMCQSDKNVYKSVDRSKLNLEVNSSFSITDTKFCKFLCTDVPRAAVLQPRDRWLRGRQ